MQKINSLSYISNFLTRANFIEQKFVTDCLKIMSGFLKKLKESAEF